MADHIRNPDPAFPDRPQHPDFLMMSEAVIEMDERIEKARDRGGEFVTMIRERVDLESLAYMADNRGARSASEATDADMAAKASFMDGFVLGVEFARRQRDSQVVDGNRRRPSADS